MPVSNLLDKATEDMLNKAVHAELYASHLYRHVANQMQRVGFFGTQKFFAGESADELTHYQRIADYMNDRGAMAKVPALEACTETVGDMVEAIELGYETERQLRGVLGFFQDDARLYRLHAGHLGQTLLDEGVVILDGGCGHQQHEVGVAHHQIARDDLRERHDLCLEVR